MTKILNTDMTTPNGAKDAEQLEISITAGRDAK